MKGKITLKQRREEERRRKRCKQMGVSYAPSNTIETVVSRSPILNPRDLEYHTVVFLDDERKPEDVWLPKATGNFYHFTNFYDFAIFLDREDIYEIIAEGNMYFALDHYLADPSVNRSAPDGQDALNYLRTTLQEMRFKDTVNVVKIIRNGKHWVVVRGHSSDSSMNDSKRRSWKNLFPFEE